MQRMSLISDSGTSQNTVVSQFSPSDLFENKGLTLEAGIELFKRHFPMNTQNTDIEIGFEKKLTWISSENAIKAFFICLWNNSIRGLKFTNCVFPQETEAQFFEHLKFCEDLQSLEVIQCQFVTKNLRILEPAFLSLKTHLQRFSLAGIDLDLANMKHFAALLWNNSCLKEFNLKGCQLQEDSLSHFLSMLGEVKCLEVLILDNNFLGDEHACLIAEWLSNQPHLKKLSLLNNRISDIGMEILLSVTPNRPFELILLESLPQPFPSPHLDLSFPVQKLLGEMAIKEKKEEPRDETFDILAESFDMQKPSKTLWDLMKEVQPKQKEKLFEKLLKKNFTLVNLSNDGECLYRALAQSFDQKEVFFTVQKVKDMVITYMLAHREEFKHVIADIHMPANIKDPVEYYCNQIRSGALWGGTIECKAFLGALKEQQMARDIFIYDSNFEPEFTPQGDILPNKNLRFGSLSGLGQNPIYLYRKGASHYDVLFSKKGKLMPIPPQHARYLT